MAMRWYIGYVSHSRKILIVEDDSAIRRGLADAVAVAGFSAVEAADGKTGLELALTVDCDLVLLDLVLPGGDGLEILREVRISRPTLPVIILTARGADRDRVTGLQLGADDYVVKPFSLAELLARIKAVLRRSPERPADVTRLRAGSAEVRLDARRIRHENGEETELTETESHLLRYLAANAGRCVGRDEILHRVWRLDPTHLSTRAVDMTIARLREKLRDDSGKPRILITVRGKGYLFAEGQS